MWAAMRVETNMSLPVPTSGEDGEQSVMGESHADDSDLVRSEAIRDIDTMHVEVPEDLIVLSCEASSQTRGCVGCTRLKVDIRMWGNKYSTLKEKYGALTKQPAKVFHQYVHLYFVNVFVCHNIPLHPLFRVNVMLIAFYCFI